MPDLKLTDVSLHYEIDGSGPPLLLLAGMLSDSATWAGFAPLLSDHFTVIRPDNRTTGRTTPWNADTSMALMAQDALALMEHLDLGPFHVAGHSMGGLLAMDLATIAPKNVSTVGVFASGRVRLPRTLAAFRALHAVRSAPKGEELWLRALYPWIFGPAFFEDPQNAETALLAATNYPYAQSVDAMAHQIEAFSTLRPVAKPEHVTCPTFVAYAGRDILVPPDQARPSFQGIANLTELTIAEAGHSIVWDAPEELAERYLEFLAQS